MLGAFARAVGAEVASAEPGLSAALAASLAAATQVWPKLVLEADVYAAHLARVAPTAWGTPELLGELSAGDLYLAAAVLAKRRDAETVFESLLKEAVSKQLAALRLQAAAADDVMQRVREHLLVGSAQSGPALARYGGRGPLRAFLGVVTANLAASHLRGSDAPVESDDDVIHDVAGLDAEGKLMRAESHEILKAAVHEAMATLSARERAILGFHYQDGKSLEAIGKVYGAHRTTVAKWLDEARNKLRTRARARAAVLLARTPDGDFRDMLDSTIDLSLSRIL